jgi:hypothetical protein
MNPLTFILAFFALVVSGSAGAVQTCKSKATQQKLTGEVLLNFVKQCELDVLVACANQTAGKPEEQMNSCVVKALGVGPNGASPTSVRTTPIVRAVRDVASAGLACAE